MHGGDIYRNKVNMDFSVNINPLGAPESVKMALAGAARDADKYPDIECEGLRDAISSSTGIGADEIICGNGSSELFLAVVHALNPGKILIPVPSFSGYEKAADASGAEVVFYKMKESGSFCLDRGFISALTGDVDMLLIANPNNPTGMCVEGSLLEQILLTCKERNIYVVLDECFIEFTDAKSCLSKIDEYKNLIVVRAFTKTYAIPGVRLGYLACGDACVRKRIRRHLPEWNVSVFAQAAGMAAVKEKDYLKAAAETVRKEREYLEGELGKAGFKVYPSETNYILFYTNIPLAEKLLERGILIRNCSDFKGLGQGYYRIAVKRHAENAELIRQIIRSCSHGFIKG